MNDIPVPVEALNDVLPGSPWQPEHAARYNALNALLRQEERSPSAGPVSSGNGEILLPVRNITGEVLPGNKPVEICVDPPSGDGINFRRPILFGRAVSDGSLFWGIATEDIAPGYGGLVQVSGVAVLESVRGTPARYVVPKPDGLYHFSSTGRAEVLYRTDYLTYPTAVVYLGGGAGGSTYNGMFAVTENEDRTVTVGGGLAITTFSEAPKTVEGTTLPAPDRSKLLFLLLNARLESGTWRFSFSIEESSTVKGYVPGEQICWHIARLTGGDYSFAQLWQGGVIDFSSRYYLG